MKTLIILKPDAIQRNLFHKFMEEIKKWNFEIDEYHFVKYPSPEKIDRHYAEHVDKEWYSKPRQFMCAGPIIVLTLVPIKLDYIDYEQEVWTEERFIKKSREFAMDFRRRHALNVTYNTIHASDSVESAKRELQIWNLT